MKFIFMGTPDFSVGTLEALLEAGHEALLVVTQPDKPKGRGKAMQFPPVKEAALAHGIPVYQPRRIRDPGCVEYLKQFPADVFVVVAFGQILTTVATASLTAVSNNEYREAMRPQTPRTVVSVDVASRKLNFRDRIDVRGMRASEAVEAVQDLVDDALMVGVGSVTILHGKGTGALKEEIRRYLRTVSEIASVADEHADRGGAGITIVTFKAD